MPRRIRCTASKDGGLLVWQCCGTSGQPRRCQSPETRARTRTVRVRGARGAAFFKATGQLSTASVGASLGQSPVSASRAERTGVAHAPYEEQDVVARCLLQQGRDGTRQRPFRIARSSSKCDRGHTIAAYNACQDLADCSGSPGRTVSTGGTSEDGPILTDGGRRVYSRPSDARALHCADRIHHIVHSERTSRAPLTSNLIATAHRWMHNICARRMQRGCTSGH